MRKWTYLFLGFLFSLILMGSGAKSQSDQVLWEMMSRLGMRIDRTVYHHGGRIPHRLPTSQLDQFVARIADDLRLANRTKRTETDGVRYEATGTDANLTTKLIVVNDQYMKTWSRPYISIQMIQKGQHVKQSTYQRLAKILSRYRLTPQIDCSMQGSKPYQNERFEQFITKTLRYLQANEVEAIRTEQIMSISAWSPRLSGGLTTQGGQMNIQVALKLDEQADRILFTIGSPIITIEY